MVWTAINFILQALLAPAMTIGFCFLRQTKWYKRQKYIFKQLIFGVSFGILGIVLTILGIDIGPAVINIRDAAPVAAGLIFGLPAGIIAGVMTGIFRLLQTLIFGIGAFSVVACTISAVVSGVVAGLVNHFLYKGKYPTWIHGVLVGLITETSHVILIFVTNYYHTYEAFLVVRAVTFWMIPFVTASSFLSTLSATLINYKYHEDDEKIKRRRLSNILQFGLLIISGASFTIYFGFFFKTQTDITERTANNTLKLDVSDAYLDVGETSNQNLLTNLNETVNEVESTKYDESTQKYNLNNAYLINLGESHVLNEINYINEAGIIVASSIETNVGFNMKNPANAQAYAFMTALENEDLYYVQDYMMNSVGEYRKYAGAKLLHGGYIQGGWNEETFRDVLNFIMIQVVKNRHIGSEGYMILADSSGNILYTPETAEKVEKLTDLGFTDEMIKNPPESVLNLKILDQDSHVLMKNVEGYLLIGVMIDSEITLTRDISLYVGAFFTFLILAVLFISLYLMLDKLVIKELEKTNKKLELVSLGYLDTTFDSKSSGEFEHLSNSINSTVSNLKGYIAKESERINKELETSKEIQTSSLPSHNAYIHYHEFNIYASMATAKEVGGDFYDYFMLPNNKFAIVIADVSGKGIPAALYMMRAKSTIKSLTEMGLSVEEVMLRTNKNLCLGNENCMFVTVWMGIVDLNTGVVEYTNAGHNAPLIKRNGKFEYLKTKPNLFLGAFEKSKYTKEVFKLLPGDSIYLYTDGITEATNKQGKLYGEEALLECINTVTSPSPNEIINKVTSDVEKFVDGFEQSDDITQLAFTYNGPAERHEFVYKAEVKNLEIVQGDVRDELKKKNLSDIFIDKINLCVEEIFVNIASYSYKDEIGNVKLFLEICEHEVALTFIDAGIAFNPLKKDDPDITLSAEERQIGGLGIFMVKKIMDHVYYTNQESQNILIISKYFNDKDKEN